jgi:hypothetical protein
MTWLDFGPAMFILHPDEGVVARYPRLVECMVLRDIPSINIGRAQVPSVIVIPTAEEQNKIANGQEPDASNLFSRDFDTSEELQSYVEGLEGLPDGIGYEVIKDDGLTVVISFDGDETSITFTNDAEKRAYFSGLEDADGWMSPQKFDEDDDGYEALKTLMSASAPKP